jgi:hypothetical protein
MKSYISILSLLFLPLFTYSQHKEEPQKDSKYILTSFKVFGEDLPYLGTINEAKFFFRPVGQNDLYFIIESSKDSKLMYARLNHLDSDSYFPNDATFEKLSNYASHKVEFIESPWKELGLKSGMLHITSINLPPRKILAYLYLEFPTGLKVIKLKGVYEGDLTQDKIK